MNRAIQQTRLTPASHPRPCGVVFASFTVKSLGKLTPRKCGRYNSPLVVSQGESMKAHQQPKTLGILALALLCFPVAGAWAQTGGAAAPSGQMKIAILNVRQAIVATAEGKQASAQLQTQFAAPQNDLQNMQKQISDLQARLANNHGTLSDDEAGRLQRQGEMLTRQFQRK